MVDITNIVNTIREIFADIVTGAVFLAIYIIITKLIGGPYVNIRDPDLKKLKNDK